MDVFMAQAGAVHLLAIITSNPDILLWQDAAAFFDLISWLSLSL
jgi:hypothetical protein